MGEPSEQRNGAALGPGLPPSPDPWPKHDSRRGVDLRLFQARHDLLENPRTGAQLERLVLECPDWVNVVALTPERELVVVAQYRFGVESVTLEIPGGMVDPGEAPEHAARRELEEETGYRAERWTYLGNVQPNPAVQNNLLHTWLAEDARLSAGQALDPGEDIAVGTLPLDEVVRAVRDGRIAHSLVLCALMHVLDFSNAALRGR
jgi:ADP-ribose pyrophosphatase